MSLNVYDEGLYVSLKTFDVELIEPKHETKSSNFDQDRFVGLMVEHPP